MKTVKVLFLNLSLFISCFCLADDSTGKPIARIDTDTVPEVVSSSKGVTPRANMGVKGAFSKLHSSAEKAKVNPLVQRKAKVLLDAMQQVFRRETMNTQVNLSFEDALSRFKNRRADFTFSDGTNLNLEQFPCNISVLGMAKRLYESKAVSDTNS